VKFALFETKVKLLWLKELTTSVNGAPPSTPTEIAWALAAAQKTANSNKVLMTDMPEGRPERRPRCNSHSDDVEKYVADLRIRAVLEDVDGLPRAEAHASIANRNR